MNGETVKMTTSEINNQRCRRGSPELFMANREILQFRRRMTKKISRQKDFPQTRTRLFQQNIQVLDPRTGIENHHSLPLLDFSGRAQLFECDKTGGPFRRDKESFL